MNDSGLFNQLDLRTLIENEKNQFPSRLKRSKEEGRVPFGKESMAGAKGGGQGGVGSFSKPTLLVLKKDAIITYSLCLRIVKTSSLFTIQSGVRGQSAVRSKKSS